MPSTRRCLALLCLMVLACQSRKASEKPAQDAVEATKTPSTIGRARLGMTLDELHKSYPKLTPLLDEYTADDTLHGRRVRLTFSFEGGVLTGIVVHHAQQLQPSGVPPCEPSLYPDIRRSLIGLYGPPARVEGELPHIEEGADLKEIMRKLSPGVMEQWQHDTLHISLQCNVGGLMEVYTDSRL